MTYEQKQRKLEYQRQYRASLKVSGDGSGKRVRLSEAQKEINKAVRKQKQKEWLISEDGLAFVKRQSERLKKFDSKKERDIARNERRRLKIVTDLRYNLQYKLNACRNRAKKESLPFDIDLDYLLSIYGETCPYLGIKLSLVNSSGNSMDALSIDKIIPSLGYVKGNVMIVSFKANVMKQDVDIQTLKKFAHSILEIHGE